MNGAVASSISEEVQTSFPPVFLVAPAREHWMVPEPDFVAAKWHFNMWIVLPRQALEMVTTMS